MEQWERLAARGAGWYWMVASMRHGDLYHVCSLAKAFGDTHGRDLPIYLIVGSHGQVQIAGMFREDFEEIVIAHGFPASPEAWRPFFKSRDLPCFGPDLPLLIHPQISLDRERFSIDFAAVNGLTWMQLYKQILHLPADVEPAAPRVRPEAVADAAALAASVGMEKGRSVLLFPYAQSLPVLANGHFAELVRDLRADGYGVYTSVAPGEAPIAGSDPIFVPFSLLPDLAEHAGWAVAVRSGICDILAPTRCRKSFIYPNLSELAPWSVNAMDYARDAYEFTFDFPGHSPAAFSAIVRSRVDMSPLVAHGRQLTPFIGSGPSEARLRRVSVADLGRDGAASAWLRRQAGGPAALILHDLPYRAHPRRGAETAAQLVRLIEAAGGEARYFACRDRGLLDFFEEVDARDLIAGRYGAADYWHSIVLACGVDLAELLPDCVSEKVLPLELSATDRVIAPGSFLGDANHRAMSAGQRPFSGAGVQFVQGWSGPEPWGLWSDSRRCRLRLGFRTPPGPAARLSLRFNTALSEALPEIGCAVSVNGVDLFHSRLAHIGGPSVLEVPFGAALEPEATSVSIGFAFDRLTSPRDQGTGVDRRLLGMGLLDLQILDVDPGEVAEIAQDVTHAV